MGCSSATASELQCPAYSGRGHFVSPRAQLVLLCLRLVVNVIELLCCFRDRRRLLVHRLRTAIAFFSLTASTVTRVSRRIIYLTVCQFRLLTLFGDITRMDDNVHSGDSNQLLLLATSGKI